MFRARHHPHRTHDLRSGSQDHHPSKKLGAENHMLQLVWCSWWWSYVPETCRAKNISIKLPRCIKLAFHIISWGRCTFKQPSNNKCVYWSVLYVKCVPKCWQHSAWTAWPSKLGPTGCPKTSVTFYQSMQHKVPEEHRSHLHCRRSLKSCMLVPCYNTAWHHILQVIVLITLNFLLQCV
jgi:hypothetical protein